ncbi:hypothetical protein HSBAA_53780 [Vreelandella sulfidaeris]|uniref:Uncharacterized protein n=1 Tax=Vreelandella sulfidaeris TaxID=115553 RepID=A0A455UCW3_9GAMM|nr:hypothetical protein HSBAA_53780 [Halomonas sulfidaeris]
MNGSADSTDADCSPVKPPEAISVRQIAAISTPQITRLYKGGLIEPLSVICATIYEAESADVTRKIKISIIATTDSTPEKGINSNISNSATVILSWVAAAKPTSVPFNSI